MDFPGGSVVKNLPMAANEGDVRDVSLIPGLGRFSRSRKWQPTLVVLPGKSHGDRSLVGYSSWSHKESDVTELLSAHTENLDMYRLMGINSCLSSSWSTHPLGHHLQRSDEVQLFLSRCQAWGLRVGWATGVGGVLLLRSDMGRTKIRSHVFWLKVTAASTPGHWQCCVV